MGSDFSIIYVISKTKLYRHELCLIPIARLRIKMASEAGPSDETGATSSTSGACAVNFNGVKGVRVLLLQCPCGGSSGLKRAGDNDETQAMDILEIPDPTPEKAPRNPERDVSADEQRRAFQGPAAARVGTQTREAFTPTSEAWWFHGWVFESHTYIHIHYLGIPLWDSIYIYTHSSNNCMYVCIPYVFVYI